MDEYLTKLSMLPEYMRGAMQRYIERGIPPGHFLSALISNDLRETFARADDLNAAAVRDYVVFLYSYAPSGCWGSPQQLSNWIKRGGLMGSEAASADAAAAA